MHASVDSNVGPNSKMERLVSECRRSLFESVVDEQELNSASRWWNADSQI